MVNAMRSKVFNFLLLCLCISLTVAEPWQIHVRRQDGPTDSPAPAPTPTDGPRDQPTATDGRNNEGSITDRPSATPSTNSTSNSVSSTSISVTSTISNIDQSTPTSHINYTGYNFTLTPHLLPLQPEITPGFAVGGVLLLVSGAVYALVGIKNKWLHIYLSAAYLASLAVTVLVLYVMNPPVSNAIQGAYLVGIVMTGLILGGAAIVFTEMTEGLGCLFGGFCFSMWLLVLKPGGLLTSTGSKTAFIAAFTLAGFSTSFSHYTRPYALIGFISFGGATALVMGIDCLSRAGLKEFWAYLWDLNSNLFPLGATSYPLTRGIKVEIASIIVIFLAGIVSQMKLWKIIKARREQRDTERKQDERTLEQEEENVGRRIEHANAEERSKWEAVYGDKDAPKQPNMSRDSGVGDMESQMKGAMSTVTSLRRSNDEIEMAQMSSPLATGSGLMTAKDGGPITVRVARDYNPLPDMDEHGSPVEPEMKRNSRYSTRSQQRLDEEKVWVLGADGEARLERRASQGSSKRFSNSLSNGISSPVPDVVPLPFRIPEGDHEDDRSSVATFADEDEGGVKRRHSKRPSQASILMRKLSQRSQRNSKHISVGDGHSTEDLIIPRGNEDDRASSVAATMDGLSDDDDMRSIRSSLNGAHDSAGQLNSPLRIEITGAIPEIPPKSPARVEDMKRASSISTPVSDGESTSIHNSKDGLGADQDVNRNSLTTSTDLKHKAASVSDREDSQSSTKDKPSPSIVSEVRSKKGSITKTNLPPALSRVVMSYRTNEWAKHLSNADAPEVEELKLVEDAVLTQSPVEAVARVNVEELQQTPENAMPPPAPRSASQMSNYGPPPARSASQMSNYGAPPMSRSNSNTSNTFVSPSQSRPETSMSSKHQESGPPLRSTSSGPPQTHQNNSFIRASGRSASTPFIPLAIAESPTEEDFNASTPDLRSESRISRHVPWGSTNTLIGRRDTMLRSKPFYTHPSGVSSSQDFAPQSQNSPYLQNIPVSQVGSEAGSMYNYRDGNDEDENMPLSARRDLIRQSSLQRFSTPVPPPLQSAPVPFDSHQPQRQSSIPSTVVREQQLASWRASVQHDLQKATVPRASIEQQRSALWHERQQEEQKKALQDRMRGERDNAFDERMRRGDMLEAHREALRKMQAAANRNA